MSELSNCVSCQGLIPSTHDQCPHCSAYVSKLTNPLMRHLLRGATTLAGGSAFALTLMACYGAPPCEPADDGDGDGYCYDDCDDANAQIYPGAEDPYGDGVDQNCDGEDGDIYLDSGTLDDDAGIDEEDDSASDAGVSDAG